MNIEFHTEVLKDLQRLPRPAFGAALRAIVGLAQNPRPSDTKKLAGSTSDWRIRIGEYRIVYEIDDPAERVLVLRVAHRRDVYRS